MDRVSSGSLVETKMRCFKLLGERIMARDFRTGRHGRQQQAARKRSRRRPTWSILGGDHTCAGRFRGWCARGAHPTAASFVREQYDTSHVLVRRTSIRGTLKGSSRSQGLLKRSPQQAGFFFRHPGVRLALRVFRCEGNTTILTVFSGLAGSRSARGRIAGIAVACPTSYLESRWQKKN